jgi:hypothetical protein
MTEIIIEIPEGVDFHHAVLYQLVSNSADKEHRVKQVVIKIAGGLNWWIEKDGKIVLLGEK